MTYTLENNNNYYYLITHFNFGSIFCISFPLCPLWVIIIIVKSESRTLRHVQCSQLSAILHCLLKMLPFYHPLRISKWGKILCATHSLSGSQTWWQMTKWLWIHLHLLDPLYTIIMFFRITTVQQTSLTLSVYNVYHVVRIKKKLIFCIVK